jgi:hypothetical protein
MACWPQAGNGPTRARELAARRQADRPISEADKDRFIEALANGSTVTDAAVAARRSRKAMYNLRASDPEFAERWADAWEQGTDVLEREAQRHAVEGWQEPVVSKGEVVTHVTRYSDRLLELLLRGRRPERYHRFDASRRDIAVKVQKSGHE